LSLVASMAATACAAQPTALQPTPTQPTAAALHIAAAALDTAAPRTAAALHPAVPTTGAEYPLSALQMPPSQPNPTVGAVTVVAAADEGAPRTADETANTVSAAGSTEAIVNTSTSTSTGGYAGTWGVYTPAFPASLSTVATLQREMGRPVDYVMWYTHWVGPYSAPDLADLSAVAANGSIPIVTWMSDDPTGTTTITDQEIAAGDYDSYIRSWAEELKAFGRTVLLRFDHEMNGNWYGWSPGVNGNTAAGYVAAYRHVHQVFAQVGARNVKFVWSPNVAYPGSTPLASLYPGDGYVDYVGVDGYNWGTLDGHTWQTPEELFGPTLEEVAALTSRPVLVTEVASTSEGGDKAAWISSLFVMLRSTPQVKGFVWFDAVKETDWQIDSSSQTLESFRLGLAGSAGRL
jgi:beta-mannanase